MVVSSRREKNVKRAEAELRKEGLSALGVVCHVANEKQRQNLIDQVRSCAKQTKLTLNMNSMKLVIPLHFIT